MTGSRHGRRGMLLLGTAAGLVLLMLACWFGARERPHTAAVALGPESEGTIVAEAASAGKPESSPADVTLSPEAATQPDDAEAQLPMIESPSPQAAVAAPTPKKDGDPVEAPPVAAVPKEPVPAMAPRRLRSDVTEDDLRKQLVEAPEFGLSPAAKQALAQSYMAQYRSSASISMGVKFDPYTLQQHFPQAGELPIRSASACQLGSKEAATLGALAKKLHAYLDSIAPKDETGMRANPTRLRDVLREERRGKRPEWLRAEALPAMVQILMAEDVPLRLILVDMLAEVDAKPATVALAQRAVFDVSREVRQAASAALRDRPRTESRPILVEALRYPWPPVADHAAEALVALKDREAAPLLVAQLSKPDPAAPYASGKSGGVVREMVRINHRANCLLCHVPAVSGNDAVVGEDPALSLTTRNSGWGGGGGKSSSGGRINTHSLWIRADVQFLRQDFSVTFPVGLPGVGVDGLRFDFLVATRPLKGAELRAWKQQPPPEPTAYPQREATLFALCALTGKDVGPTTEAWVQLFPRADAEAEGMRLSAALRRAAPEKLDLLLARYGDAKDEVNTTGLACAIPHLPIKLQDKAREALVERLSRLPADQLRPRLQDDDHELRHAAARACVRKADKDLVPDLIGLLADLEPAVADGAYQTLKRLTGHDFGPTADASHEERVAAAANWHQWWRQTGP
jgi:hypothetical protein